MILTTHELPTPVGTILLVEAGGAAQALGFVDEQAHAAALIEGLRRRHGAITLAPASAPSDVATRLRAYLDGDLRAVDAVAVEAGGTAFQRRVWAALRRIPPGTTASYGDIARAVGSPAAVRAVGLANARNPVGIIVPCHRVIRADGSLCGYAGGLPRKAWLLEHERRAAAAAGARALGG